MYCQRQLCHQTFKWTVFFFPVEKNDKNSNLECGKIIFFEYNSWNTFLKHMFLMPAIKIKQTYKWMN